MLEGWSVVRMVFGVGGSFHGSGQSLASGRWSLMGREAVSDEGRVGMTAVVDWALKLSL